MLSFLPDYAFKNSDTVGGTSFSGIAGSLIVLILCTVICLIIRSVSRHKTNRKNTNDKKENRKIKSEIQYMK